MINKKSTAIMSLVIACCMMSCNNYPPKNLLAGTWKPMNPEEAMASKMTIQFLENKTAVIKIEGRAPRGEDSATYEIKNQGKMLSTKDKSGKVENVQILELTDKKLVILSAGKGDTMKLVRSN